MGRLEGFPSSEFPFDPSLPAVSLIDMGDSFLFSLSYHYLAGTTRTRLEISFTKAKRSHSAVIRHTTGGMPRLDVTNEYPAVERPGDWT